MLGRNYSFGRARAFCFDKIFVFPASVGMRGIVAHERTPYSSVYAINKQ